MKKTQRKIIMGAVFTVLVMGLVIGLSSCDFINKIFFNKAEEPAVIYEVSADGTYAEVVGYTGTLTELIIAQEYNGVPVKTIRDNAFKNSSITSITISDSITTIGNFSFQGCKSLTDLRVGKGITRIGLSAFDGCVGLKNVYITDLARWCDIEFDPWTYPLLYAQNFYLNGELITELVIPDGVTRIGCNAFCGYRSLTSVKIPNSVKIIGSGAFSGCSALKAVTIPDGIMSIESGAFEYCSPELYSTYYSGIYIGNEENPYAILIKFDTSSETKIIYPSTEVIIANNAFAGLGSLKYIVIPDNVTKICPSAFVDCPRLERVEIGDGVTSIGDSAFEGCDVLRDVIIGNGVTIIGDRAFSACFDLKSISFNGTVEQWNAIEKGSSWNNYTIYCADGKINKDGTVNPK